MIHTKLTKPLLISLGAPPDCPEDTHMDSHGFAYWPGLSIFEEGLVCAGLRTTGNNEHPVCTECKIKNVAHPSITKDEYWKQVGLVRKEF